MQIGLREAAGLLGVPERTVEKWIREDSLPAVRVGGQLRFNRTEILEWATSRRMTLSSVLFPGGARGERTGAGGLERAIRAGGIRYGVKGADRHSVLEAALSLMPMPDSADRALLLQVMEAREAMGSTGIGDGIAIPHVRNPIVLDIPEPMITLSFLEREVEFGSLDGRPVDTLFMMMSPTVDSHLAILSRLAFALRQPAFMEAVARRCPETEILSQAASVDLLLLSRTPPGRQG